MAIFHSHIKIFSRGNGESAVGAAAYRSGQKLTNEFDGIIHDYTRKTGVVHTEIFLPANAPPEFADRSTLWNSVEKIEKQCNVQLAREINVALPVELTFEQNLSLLRRYVQENFISAGMAVDLAVHIKKEDNPHAHILMTMRPFNEDGTWGAKARKVNGAKVCTVDWNEHSKATEWRKNWAAIVNEYLEANDHAARIDHRSYEKQGVDKIPSIHMGAAASQMEKRGIKTDRGNFNREVEISNREIRQVRARIGKTRDELNVILTTAPPSLHEYLSSILNNENRSKPTNLKIAAETLMFMQDNGLANMFDLADKVSAMHRRCNTISDGEKKVRRRIETLNKHLVQSGNHKKYRSVAAQYDRLRAAADEADKATGFFAKSKAEKAHKERQDFYRDHEFEIGTFRDAEKYLKSVLQSRYNPKKSPPVSMWEKELADKKVELATLTRDFNKLRKDVREAEAMKRFAADLLVPDEPQIQQINKIKTMEVYRS
jgi:ATP-dependent exoDNAse (exonuclease V) alpha subunit